MNNEKIPFPHKSIIDDPGNEDPGSQIEGQFPPSNPPWQRPGRNPTSRAPEHKQPTRPPRQQ